MNSAEQHTSKAPEQTGLNKLRSALETKKGKVFVTSAILLGGTSLSACASAEVPNVTVSPAGVEVETPTLEQYVDQLAQYKDPAELSLPADATAEEIGKWAVALENMTSLASCDRIDLIGEASVTLALHGQPGDADALYEKIAEKNINTIFAAEFGSDWQSIPVPIANDLYNASVKRNTNGITNCMKNTPGVMITNEFVSATELVSDNDKRVVKVDYNATSEDSNNIGLGEWQAVYTLKSVGENLTVEDIKFQSK